MTSRPIARQMRLTFTGGMICAVLLVGTVGLLLPAAQAEEGMLEEQMELQDFTLPTQGNWNVTLGIGVAGEPDYPGAKRYRPAPVPMVSITYGNRFFLGPGGLGVNVLNWHGLRAGPLVGFQFGRSQSADPHLHGLGDIQPSATAGGFIAYRAGPFAMYATLRQAVSHTQYGLTGNVAFNYLRLLVPGKLALGIGPDIDVANDAYDRTWFGVSPSQSARSGLPVYTPGGGVRDVGLHALLTYRYSAHLLLRSFGNVRRLVGNVAESPIVQSKTQGVIGIGVAYHF